MLTSIFVFTAAMFGLLWSIHKLIDANNQSKKFPVSIVAIFGVIVICVSCCIFEHHLFLTSNSDIVAKINLGTPESTNVYYNADKNEYYILESNMWNFFEPQSKKVIPEEEIFQYFELIDKIKN